MRQTKQNKEKDDFILRGYYTLFWLSSDKSSVKTQLHSDGNKGFLFYLSFVWRQSEFAFFGAWLRSRTFYLYVIERGEAMSIPKRMTVNCSKCGKPLSVTVFESVNSGYADDIAMQIMSGDLFNVECPHCKFVSHLEYDILYHDLRHGAMIWVVHNNSPEYTKRVSEIRAMQKLPYKTFRIVEDMNALKEKVSCLESNRDDRIIELCKVFTAYNLLSQRPEFEFRNAFYTAISGKELIYLYDNENDELCCELPEKAYDYLKNLFYGSHYATQFDDNYPIVDYDWAENILTPLLEAEASNLSAEEEIDKAEEAVNNTPTNDKKVCPKCKAVLSSDSEFCQGCGTKLSAPIPEPTASSNVVEELLSEFEIMEVKGSHPVIIQSAHLYCSSDREKYYLRCKFKSLSDKVISALMVDVYCFDVWGNELPTIRDAQVLDLSPKRDEVFGYSRKIPIADANTRTVNVKLKRIRFADGTIEECSGEEAKFPVVVSLPEHFDSLELAQQYNYETSRKSSFVPMQVGEFWMCSCGKINANIENDCINCGCSKQIVFNALDENFLAERYSAYIENKRIEEEKLKREREKHRLIEKQRQEELERQRMAEIQKERNLAILKRVAATEAANKKKKIIKTIVICVIVAVVAFFIVKGIIDNAHNSELRNFATQTMNEDYTNVYADVVSMEPEYFVYRYNTTKYGTKIGNGDLWEVVCRCKTVEGKTIWATFFYQYYPEGDYSDNEDDYKSFTYRSDNPLRIVGSVDTAHQVIDELEDAIGNVFVLDVSEKPKQ